MVGWMDGFHSNVGSFLNMTSADPEGDMGCGPPPPPGKSQVIWVPIWNKQLDPHPPPPPGKC